jgi:hypothetical protein
VLSAWIPVGVHVWRQSAQEQNWAQISKPPGSARPRTLVRWSGFGYERCLMNLPTEFADAAEAHSQSIPRIEWPSFLPAPRDDQLHVYTGSSGWPWLSMRWAVTGRLRFSGWDEMHAIESRGMWSLRINEEQVTLPLTPIWRGLMANAAVYAAIFGAIWVGPVAVRRARRRRRGQCAACGYSLRQFTGERCPECGGSVAGRAAR